MTEPDYKLTRFQAVTPFVIAALFGVPAAWILLVRPGWGGWEYIAAGVCGTVLVFDLPVCILILIGRPPAMTLAPLFPSAEESAFHRNLRQRPRLDDDAFYDRFYADSGIPKEIPLRVRKELERELGVHFRAIRPDDNVALAYDDLDFAELLLLMNRAFGVTIPYEACWEDIDGTFDSLVRYIARLKAEPEKR